MSHESTWETLGRFVRYEWQGLAHALLPVSACPEYAAGGKPSWAWLVVGLAAAAALGYLLIRYYPSDRRPSVMWRAGVGAVATALLLPLAASPLAGPINERADRYFYAATIGAAWIVGALFVRLQACARRWVNGALVGVALAGTLVTQGAVATWASESSLWTAAVRCAPGSPRVWASLSRANRHAEHDQLASKAVEHALSLRPDYFQAHITRVYNHLWFGRQEQARVLLRALTPKSPLQRRAVRMARRCASKETAEKAAECARATVPTGEVLGDPERLSRVTESELGKASKKPLERSHMPEDLGVPPG